MVVLVVPAHEAIRLADVHVALAEIDVEDVAEGLVRPALGFVHEFPGELLARVKGGEPLEGDPVLDGKTSARAPDDVEARDANTIM